ncbi:MAG: glycosyltransferase, partial [Acidimicrobiales bacterium]|nr:glycosyltransferase [Acidimicrobiales bacterium]
VPEKGFDLLIEAVALMDQQTRPEITIVGVGSERSRLDSQARRLGVSLHLPGAVSPREIGDWYERASVVVVPSRRE